MSRPVWDLYSALKDLLELTEALMAETNRNPAPDGAVSKAKTMLQRHEQAATEQLRGDRTLSTKDIIPRDPITGEIDWGDDGPPPGNR